MAFEFQKKNTLGEMVVPEYGTERSNAIQQLHNDIYETPTNDNDGNANLPYPLQRLCPIIDGETTTNGTTGRVISLGVTLAADAYKVTWSWAGDPGLGSGDIWIEYGTTSFTIKNTGSTIGIKIRFSAERRVSA